MTRITALEVIDVRFPTSLELDGSDAMNPEPDYSAAYVVIRTDDPVVSGFSLLFTTGRGNEVACAAINSLTPYLVGLEVSALVADIGAFARVLVWDGQLRWLGPEKGVMHMAIGAVVNALWDLQVAPRRPPALAGVGLAHTGGGRRPDRLHLHRRRTVSGRGAVHPAGGRSEQAPAHRRPRARRLPGLHHICRLARLRRRQGRSARAASGERRLHDDQAQGRRRRGLGHAASPGRPGCRRNLSPRGGGREPAMGSGPGG